MRRVMLMLSFVMVVGLSYSQDCSGKIPQKAIDKLNNKIRKNYCSISLSHWDSIVSINIYNVGYDINADIGKMTFASKQFLSYITLSYYRYKLNRYIEGITILWNPQTNYVAIANPISVYDRGPNTAYRELAKTIVQNNIVCVYELGGVMWGNNYIGISEDDKVYLIIAHGEKTILHLISDYPDDEWKALFTDQFLKWRGDDRTRHLKTSQKNN